MRARRRTLFAWLGRRGPVHGLTAGFVVGVLVAGGIAVASIPSSTTRQITGCVNKTSGALRVIDYQAGKRCATSESTLSWSAGYRYLGTWSATRAYAAQDVVVYSGSAYVAKAASTGKAPATNATYWGLLAQRGATGAPGAIGPRGPAGPSGAPGPSGPPGPAAADADGLLVSMDGDGAGTVTFLQLGKQCTVDCLYQGTPGQTVTLDATTDGWSTFLGWEGACTGTSYCQVTLNGSQSVRARFVKPTQWIQVGVTGGGSGTITSSPAGISCPGDCLGGFPAGTEVTFTATPAAGDGLIGGFGGLRCVREPVNQCVVVADERLVAELRFEHVQMLNWNKTLGGNVSVSPQPAYCDPVGDLKHCLYVRGTTVTLTATPDSGKMLSGWSGDCTGRGDCVLVMSADRTVQANFSSYFTLSIAKSGGGTGTVTSSPVGISCGTDCTEQYVVNTQVTLTASPDPGSRFDHWGGGGSCNNSTNPVCQQTMGFDYTLVPFFEPL